VSPSNKSVLVDALRRDTLELRLYQVCACLSSSQQRP
jgi:hypothetical protein